MAVKSRTAPARAEPAADPQTLLALYRTMVTIRSVELRLARSYAAGLIFGACHTYVGEEAVATGVSAHLGPEDHVYGTHRGHGHALAKGVPPVEVIAELYGKATGASGGRGGSMHIFKPEIGLMGTSGIVGSSITLAAGASYTFRLLRTGKVAIAYFGDGAVANGAFHEAVNLAGLWDLPVVFVCENNGYATEVPYLGTSRNPSATARARAYGLEAVEVDGNDVLAVWKAAGNAVRKARELRGPTFLECTTYRTRAHAEGMRETGYREKEEVDRWKTKDPIERFAGYLTAEGVATTDVLAGIQETVETGVNEAHAAAQAAPWPEPGTLLDHVTTFQRGERHA